MTTFDKREQAFENKYFHDEALNFKAICKRRKLIGLWAAKKLRLDAEEALEYALEIVRFGVEDSTEGAVVSKILKDITEAGLDIDEEIIRDKMSDLDEVARQQVQEMYDVER